MGAWASSGMLHYGRMVRLVQAGSGSVVQSRMNDGPAVVQPGSARPLVDLTRLGPLHTKRKVPLRRGSVELLGDKGGNLQADLQAGGARYVEVHASEDPAPWQPEQKGAMVSYVPFSEWPRPTLHDEEAQLPGAR